MVEEFEQLDFSDDTLGIDQVFEGFRHLLDSDLDFAFMVISAANYTVRTVSDLLDIFKLLFDAERGTYIVSQVRDWINLVNLPAHTNSFMPLA